MNRGRVIVKEDILAKEIIVSSCSKTCYQLSTSPIVWATPEQKFSL